MINCTVIEDLLILYVADECSEDTKKLVEEHLATCESCRKSLEALQAPSLPKPEMSPEMQKKNLTFQKGFRKIRHRWVASLLVVALIFPLLGAGILTRNEFKGEGIAFTSMDEILASRSFLRALQKKDYEKAFQYLDIEGLYRQMTDADSLSGFDWAEAYRKVDVGGETYYIRKEIHQSEYQMYLQDKNIDNFWISMMVMNSQEITYAPIPKDYFEKNIVEAQSRIQGSLQVVPEGRASVNVGYDYLLVENSEEVEYYLPAAYGSPVTFEENLMGRQASVIPAAIFEESLEEIRLQEEKILAQAQVYQNMGLKAYREKQKAAFLANMMKLEKEGIRIQSFSFSAAYILEKETGTWQINLNAVFGKEGMESSVRGIVFQSENGKLRGIGGYSSMKSDVELQTLIRLLAPSEELSLTMEQ